MPGSLETRERICERREFLAHPSPPTPKRFARRTGLPAGDRELWWVDPQAAVAAEMAAAVNINQGMALPQTHRRVAMRDRLPRVAKLFEAGLISDWLVRAIVWRTYLINDEAAMAAVDRALAAQVTRWGGRRSPRPRLPSTP
jgi:hypothetical protein